jgi:O-antigen/teichoic acid export membrane protein
MPVSRKAVLGAGAWTVGGHALSQFIRFGSNLIIARLLLPEAFGVMALASVVWVALAMFTDMGLQQGVIRSRSSDDPAYLDTVWVMQILQGAFIAILLVASAGALFVLQSNNTFSASSAYAHPDLPLALVGFAVACVIDAFASTRWALATRGLHVARLVAIEVGCQALSSLVMLSWAHVDGSVHALMAGAILFATARMVASHVLLAGPRNAFRFSRPAASEIFTFGRWVFVSSSISFLASNLDKILLGALATAETVGIYSIASQMILAVHDLVNRVTRRVGYPAISSVYRSGQSGLAATYYRARMPTDVFCLLTAGALAMCGEQIVALLYPGRYAAAGEYLSILAISLIGVRFSLLGHVYLVLGDTRLMIYEQVAKLVFLLGGMWIGFQQLGPVGAVWGIAFSYVAAAFTSALWVGRRLGLWKVRRELLAVPLLATGLVAGVILRHVLQLVAISPMGPG